MNHRSCTWCNFLRISHALRRYAHTCHGPYWAGISSAAAHVIFATMSYGLRFWFYWKESFPLLYFCAGNSHERMEQILCKDVEVECTGTGCYFRRSVECLYDGSNLRLRVEFGKQWVFKIAELMFPEGGYKRTMVDVNPCRYLGVFHSEAAKLMLGPRRGMVTLVGKDIKMTWSRSMVLACRERADLWFDWECDLAQVLPVMVYCSAESDHVRRILEMAASEHEMSGNGVHVPVIRSIGNFIDWNDLHAGNSLKDARDKVWEMACMRAIAKED